jgi:hypothetical protein
MRTLGRGLKTWTRTPRLVLLASASKRNAEDSRWYSS